LIRAKKLYLSAESPLRNTQNRWLMGGVGDATSESGPLCGDLLDCQHGRR
jgi:hypothetical protein